MAVYGTVVSHRQEALARGGVKAQKLISFDDMLRGQ